MENFVISTTGYVLGQTIGEGSYAKVRSAYSQHTSGKVALKIINQRKAPKDFREKFLPRELEILQTIRNDNLVNMYDIFKINGKVSFGTTDICVV